ncbi:unnamed protein product (macronuclear) [Paramecium tetraurelia]|uniref:Cyclic nucleotide-binding domain-containing protein n=1 Tax=Paramecium tetraurelia TaxID=5888 RepID=A0C392_PARTE|nr:uncharacterized protein GSPATT00034737001 [Paramecium tetraurelia]CAK65259.1 unnamed protein product [Paramecium tetraurelia]|eukprot:XP_001432656.1 hypothetical protein (macronuclear) [Paramecium tetraurelia strain d4-2]
MQEFKILQELIRSLKKPFEKRSEDDLYPIERMVRKIEFFQKYFADQNDLNFSYYFEHEYAIQNTAIINIDSVGDKFYVILQGQVGIYVKPNVVEDKASSTKLLEMVKLRFRQAVNNNKFKDYQINKIQSQQSDLALIKILLPGQSFGEMSLIHNRPREFTAVALQPCHFAMIRRQYFKDVVRIGQEKSSVKEMGFFANLEIFEGWNVNSIYQIYKMLEQRSYRMGDVVYLSGESVNKIYLIKEGAVDLQQVFIEEKEELEIRSVSPYMKQRGKSLHRKIATLSNHQFLGLDDVHSQEQKHRFSCVSSSSDTVLFIIPVELYMRKIYTQTTSQLYVQEFIQVQSKYQDLRNSQLQVAIHSQRQQQQQMLAKINQYKNADMLQFFQNLQGRFKTLSQESAKKFQKSSIGERSQNISAHDKYVDRSCFTRAKDRSLLGKVQTQSLYQNQAYKQVVNESRIVEKNLPNLSQFMERHLPSLHHSKSMQVRCRRQSPQKQQYLQFQNVQTSLNEDEQQLVSNVLSKGVVYQRRTNLVKRVRSTENYSQRRAIRFQDQSKY